MKLFGEHIRSLRDEQHLPLRKVAAFLDIDTSILSKMERGERPINSEQIAKLAKYFEVDAEKLYQEYLSEEVAKKIYRESNIEKILKVAEKKAKYLKLHLPKQINFNERK
jgi:transcriptional regulator with XRE-family HTH domain